MGDFKLNKTLTGTLTGSFERDSYLDGDISFNLNELSQISGLNLTDLNFVLRRSTVTVTGMGTLTSSLGTLPWNVDFDEPSQSIQFSFERENANIIDGCLSSICIAQATGIDASIILSLSSFSSILLATVSDLNISVRTTPKSFQPVQTPETSLTWFGLIGAIGFIGIERLNESLKQK